MRQLVTFVNDQGIGVYLAEGDEPVTQLAQMINPGLDVSAVVQLGLQLGDTLAPEPIKAPPPRKPKAIAKPKPTTNGHKRPSQGLGRPRQDGTPNQTWGFTQAAVYDMLRQRGPMMVNEAVAAFGYDPSEKRAQQAMNTALSVAFKAGVVTRESLEPYSPGNTSQYTRTRYTAVVVEQSSD